MDQTNRPKSEQLGKNRNEEPHDPTITGDTAIAARATLANDAFAQAQEALAKAALKQAGTALARSGLSLSARDVAALEAGRTNALAQSERLEFGAPPIGAIAEELANSPFLLQENLPDALMEAQERFYQLRNDIDPSFADEELAWALAQRFDAVEGDLEALCATEAADVAALLDNSYRMPDQVECKTDEYRIADDAGIEHVFCLQDWEYDEHACGWDGEKWDDDFDE